MIITICGSSHFKEKMLELRDELQKIGHQAIVHPDYEAFVNGEKQEVWSQIQGGKHADAKKSQGYIKWYYNAITESDAILVLNYNKKGIKNYIGCNTLMEIGFAHVNDKKIFLLNDINEELDSADEVKAMYTKVIYSNLDNIQ